MAWPYYTTTPNIPIQIGPDLDLSHIHAYHSATLLSAILSTALVLRLPLLPFFLLFCVFQSLVDLFFHPLRLLLSQGAELTRPPSQNPLSENPTIYLRNTSHRVGLLILEYLDSALLPLFETDTPLYPRSLVLFHHHIPHFAPLHNRP